MFSNYIEGSKMENFLIKIAGVPFKKQYYSKDGG